MLTQILPSYLYQQYSNDNTTPYLQAFFTAYNNTAQNYLNTFNNLELPVYTNANISGVLLDWVAYGIYGIQRPSLSAPTGLSPLGVYNTEPYNVTAYSQNVTSSPANTYTVTDDYFKRIITWNFYKGDGFQYNTQWLKRRIYRFLNGTNGVDPVIQQTYSVSVAYPSTNNVTITITNNTIGQIFKAALADGVLNVPFQYIYTVVLV